MSSHANKVVNSSAQSPSAVSTATAEGDYLTRFKKNTQRSVKAMLTRVQEDQTPTLVQATRVSALHVLSYALRLPEAWPATSALLVALAPKLEQAGYRTEWLAYLQQGVAMSRQCQDLHSTAELYLQIGLLYRLQSQLTDARTALEQSIDLFFALDEQRDEARALNQLAYVAWQQHQHDEVRALAQRALERLPTNDLARAMSLSALGLNALEEQQWQQAVTYHRMALGIRAEHGNRKEMAWSLQNLAYALRGQGEYETAIIYFEEALTILDEVQDPAHSAIVQMNLGITYSQQGNPHKALELYTQAETTFRRLGDQWYLAKVLTNQGIDCLALQEWSRAEECFALATNLFALLNDASERLNALDGLGLSYLKQKRAAEALATFEAVLADLHQIQGTRAYPNLLQVIDKQIAQAQESVEQSLNDEVIG
ncbi:MAG: tetratricopeptide repeat protein [Caldilineaceae bacterium]